MSRANTSSEANRDDGCEWYFGVPFPSKRAQATAPATQERELKVGDRVRTNGGFSFDPTTAVVVDVPGRYVNVRLDKIPYDDSQDEYDRLWSYVHSDLTLLPPTFPPNTRVRVIRNTNRYAVGDTGTVTLSSDESVGVRMDDGRYWSFKPEDLAVAPSPWGNPASGAVGQPVVIRHDLSQYVGEPANDPATPCIVMRLENGQPRPSSWPHVHQSAADATKEAERLASVNPGKQFDVYQRVTGRVGDVRVREVA